MDLFPPFFGYLYILLAIDYISKWAEAIPIQIDDHKVVVKFLKENICSWFEVLRVVISDQGTLFCSRPLRH